MLGSGLRARLACVDTRRLDPSFAGREWDATLLRELPSGIDPCGENGEFHTCVYAGPMFAAPLALETGETVTREPFVWADLKIRFDETDDEAHRQAGQADLEAHVQVRQADVEAHLQVRQNR
jgi:diphthamide synthase (EF-2-diphthine--ammonia ligase)